MIIAFFLLEFLIPQHKISPLQDGLLDCLWVYSHMCTCRHTHTSLGTRGFFLARVASGSTAPTGRGEAWNRKPHKKSQWHPGYTHTNKIMFENWLLIYFLSSFSWSGILETYKTASLVPAANTKARLLQSLVSHTEAKLDSIDISLLCPLTRSRMATPVRGRSCTHIHCFDGEAYLQLMWEKHVEKWKCPVS